MQRGFPAMQKFVCCGGWDTRHVGEIGKQDQVISEAVQVWSKLPAASMWLVVFAFPCDVTWRIGIDDVF